MTTDGTTVYFSDKGAVRAIYANGSVVTLAGDGNGNYGGADGQGTAATFGFITATARRLGRRLLWLQPWRTSSPRAPSRSQLRR